MKPLSLNGSFFFLVYSSFLYAHPQVVPPATCTCFFSKKIWPRPLPCTTWTKRECKRICAERCPSYVLQHIRFPYVAPTSLNCSTLGTTGFSRPRREFSVLAEGRSHEPDRNRAKKSLWHPGSQGFESRTSLNFSWLSFAAAKNCVKNAMIFFHIIQLTLLKVSKTFEANVSAAHSWVRCLTHGAFHVPYTTCIPEIAVLVSQSFRG